MRIAMVAIRRIRIANGKPIVTTIVKGEPGRETC